MSRTRVSRRDAWAAMLADGPNRPARSFTTTRSLVRIVWIACVRNGTP
jgi:hypothetical protein